MRRLVLPGIPFAVSLALSISTAGPHCYWQDSGFFLVAVKELGILYPPGFALYVLLCKAWTMALWFVDFTYAAHLFSAFCAAGAAGTIAVAARDLLRTKGPLFHTVEEPGPLAEWAGVSAGCLAASGYTFWAAAILAKVYSFYFLILSLLIWRMIRADESRRPRDFTLVAALIGLAWQAHPSATNSGIALGLFTMAHYRVVGGKGLAWRIGLAALLAVGPILLLPLFKDESGSVLRFGDPWTLAGFWEYLTGSRFTSRPGAFGLEGSRVISIARYFWEEFLGVGVVLSAIGFYRLWLVNRRLLLGLGAWVIPVLVVTLLFKLEGQHDFWMVAAWIPLWLVAAVGLSVVGQLREAAVAIGFAGVVWGLLANRADLDQRNYTLAETLGRIYLETPDPGSVVSLSSDDAQSLTLYLQRVRKLYPGVSVVGDVVAPLPGSGVVMGKALWFDAPEGAGNLRGGLVGAGPLFRFELQGQPAAQARYWKEPLPAEEIPKLFRRARGQFVERRDGTIRSRPEPYEMRLLRVLLLGRKNLADLRAREGKLSEAAGLYESILRLDPGLETDPSTVYPLAVLQAGLKHYDRAEALFRRALTLELEPRKRAETFYFLAALYGTRPEAAEWREKALASPDLAPELRAKLESR